MKITSLHLQNFKRFTDLKIDHLPQNAKLVLLIGSNGSGKSSVFDAFGLCTSLLRKEPLQGAEALAYYKKTLDKEASLGIAFDNNERLDIEILDNHVSTGSSYKVRQIRNLFYGRSSFRQIPRLTRTTLGGAQVDFERDSDRPKYLIDRDSRFENDIERIAEIVLKEVFISKKTEEIIERYINPVNDALRNIFGENTVTTIQLTEIIPPLEGKIAQINFRKGQSEIHYNYLSAGEKEVINLLFNLLTRKELYKDSIYFLDEIDLHLNTKLQFNLLQEITENWIPENAQLWTATHSLGFIDYAKQSEKACILDFDDLDFDVPVTLTPAPKDSEIYEIAVGKAFLEQLFTEKEVYFVENKDAELYALLGFKDLLFISETNRNSVFHKAKAHQQKGIVDRDFLSDDDLSYIRKQYPNLRILDFYSIENYLFHPKNLEEYFGNTQKAPFDKESYQKALVEAKNSDFEVLLTSIKSDRFSYPYFSEPEWNGKKEQNRFKNKSENDEQVKNIVKSLKSDVFEVFYPFYPMKSFGKQVPQRKNLQKSDLAKTSWFKAKMEKLLAA